MNKNLFEDPMLKENRKIKEELWKESGYSFKNLVKIIRKETKVFLEQTITEKEQMNLTN